MIFFVITIIKSKDPGNILGYCMVFLLLGLGQATLAQLIISDIDIRKGIRVFCAFVYYEESSVLDIVEKTIILAASNGIGWYSGETFSPLSLLLPPIFSSPKMLGQA